MRLRVSMSQRHMLHFHRGLACKGGLSCVSAVRSRRRSEMRANRPVTESAKRSLRETNSRHAQQVHLEERPVSVSLTALLDVCRRYMTQADLVLIERAFRVAAEAHA